MRRGPGFAAVVMAAFLLVLAPAAHSAPPESPQPRTSLADVESDVMCTVCGVPLSMAREAPAAKRQRALIQQLVDKGLTKQQIKDELVATYGSGVLTLPARSGFDLAVWLVPIVLLLIGLVALAALLVTWKRRGTAGGPPPGEAVPLPPDDAELVDSALRERD